MALLKAHADKEQAQFETEWRELGRVLEQDRRLKERMAGQDKGETVASLFLEVIYLEYCCHGGRNRKCRLHKRNCRSCCVQLPPFH